MYNEIKALLDSQGIRYKENSQSFILSCPKPSCGKEKLYIRKKDGVFVCFRCRDTEGFQGKAEYAFKELTDLSIKQIKEFLYNKDITAIDNDTDIEINDFFGQNDQLPQELTLQEVQWPYNYYPIDNPFSIKGVDYLKTRGIPIDVASKYGLRYCPELRRVIFPVRMYGKLIGWQGRAIYKTEYIDEETGETQKVPKSITSTGLLKSSTLMFYDSLKEGSHVVVCEGPIDAIKTDYIGGAVCTMGKGISKKQIELIRKKNPSSIYIGLDPDADVEMSMLVNEFSDIDCYLLEVPKPYKDLGDMSFSEVFDLFKKAVKVDSSYLFVDLK